MEINAGMFFLEIDMKSITVMHIRYLLIYSIPQEHKRSRISSAIDLMLTEQSHLIQTKFYKRLVV
jgi:hypothetical protein